MQINVEGVSEQLTVYNQLLQDQMRKRVVAFGIMRLSTPIFF